MRKSYGNSSLLLLFALPPPFAAFPAANVPGKGLELLDHAEEEEAAGLEVEEEATTGLVFCFWLFLWNTGEASAASRA